MKTLRFAMIGIFMLLMPTISQVFAYASTAVSNNSTESYAECQKKIGDDMQMIVNSINKTKAILLATSSNDFQSKVSGYKYVFSGIFTNMTENQKTCGDVKLTSVVAEFSILDKSSKFVKFVEVGEDPLLTHVTLVEDVFVQKCDNNCPPPGPPAVDIIQDQQPLTPLRQIASGVLPKDVTCKSGFTLVLKAEDQFPACVKPDTANILIERGWAQQALALGYTNLTRVDVVSIQSISPPNPGGPKIQLTLKNTGTTPITSLKATLELNNEYNFDFKDVIVSNPLESGHSASDTEILIGAGFRTELAYPLTISGVSNHIPFTHTENVYIR